MIGINPATDSPARTQDLLILLDDIRTRLAIPTQSCVLSHVTTTLGLIERGAPVDLVFNIGPEYLYNGKQITRAGLGRRLGDGSIDMLTKWHTGLSHRASDAGTLAHERPRLVFVVADVLAATAAQTHATPLLDARLPSMRKQGWELYALVLARHGRVALDDDCGRTIERNSSRGAIGREGMSSSDSLGAI